MRLEKIRSTNRYSKFVAFCLLFNFRYNLSNLHNACECMVYGENSISMLENAYRALLFYISL